MNPSVIELFNLMKGHMSDILFRESGNRSCIYLYRTDDYWVAFERSAFNLCRSFAGTIVTPMKVANVPFPIVMASVVSKDVLSATRNLNCLRRTEKLRVYDAKAFSGSNVSFSRWHNQKVRSIAVLLAHQKDTSI